MLPTISSYNNTADADLDVLAEFISYDKADYGQGMDNLAISYVNREMALQNHCSFFDAHHVAGNVNKLNVELVGQHSPYLVSSPINVYGSDNAPSQAYDEVFENTLKAIDRCNKDFDKIFIPIGCQEDNMPGHNIALILEKASVGFKATILDQMGGVSYIDTKAKMITAMQNIGISDIDYNRYPLTNSNRNDCASVTSLLRDYTLSGYNMRDIKTRADRYCETNREGIIGSDEVDAQHEEDQMTLLESADRLAADIIKRNAQKTVALRGIKGLQTPRDMVTDCVHKHMRMRNSSAAVSYYNGNQR